MAKLRVENVPDELYEAVCGLVRRNGRSVADELIALLGRNLPMPADLQPRREVFRNALELSRQAPLSPGAFPSAEEDIREDRAR